MTNEDERGEGGKKCRKFDDVICERPLRVRQVVSKPMRCDTELRNGLYL